LADVQEGMEHEFIKRADYLYKDLGTIALVNASTFFKELHIGVYYFIAVRMIFIDSKFV